MECSQADYTILFRQLNSLPMVKAEGKIVDIINHIEEAFYEGVGEVLKKKWTKWIGQWLQLVFRQNS